MAVGLGGGGDSSAHRGEWLCSFHLLCQCSLCSSIWVLPAPPSGGLAAFPTPSPLSLLSRRPKALGS